MNENLGIYHEVAQFLLNIERKTQERLYAMLL